jgi:hypothetical protein
VLASCVVLALVLVLLGRRLSPLEVRANLPLGASELGERFLTGLAEDPERVLLTTRRENSTWARDMGEQAGSVFWLRSYGDPARPGLPPRLLLTSRSRGARLLIPLAALELESAFSAPAGEDPARRPVPKRELVKVFRERDFAGLYLELFFPERARDEQGLEIDHDLVVVRGNQVRTSDFLLQPYGRFYRDAITEGKLPAGPLQRSGAHGDELAFAMFEDLDRPVQPLFVPVSLFDELGLCWGTQQPTLVDDRWWLDACPSFEPQPLSPELRSSLAWNGAMHLAARVEDEPERRLLAAALERLDSAGGRP